MRPSGVNASAVGLAAVASSRSSKPVGRVDAASSFAVAKSVTPPAKSTAKPIEASSRTILLIPIHPSLAGRRKERCADPRPVPLYLLQYRGGEPARLYARWTVLGRLQGPVWRVYPGERHNTSGRYYQRLMYIGLRTSDTLHKKPCHIGQGLC